MSSALHKVCTLIRDLSARDVDVGVWIPVAGDVPEEEAELIKVCESEDLVDNDFKHFL